MMVRADLLATRRKVRAALAIWIQNRAGRLAHHEITTHIEDVLGDALTYVKFTRGGKLLWSVVLDHHDLVVLTQSFPLRDLGDQVRFHVELAYRKALPRDAEA